MVLMSASGMDRGQIARVPLTGADRGRDAIASSPGAVRLIERGKSARLSLIFHVARPGGDGCGKPRRPARIFHARAAQRERERERKWERGRRIRRAVGVALGT